MKIAVFGWKGGVGKTTSVTTLARLWSDQTPLIIDTDYQKSTLFFAESLQGCKIVEAEPSQIRRVLEKDRLTLIDCPPSPRDAREALDVADLVLIPFGARTLEFRAMVTAFDALDRDHPKLEKRLCLTMLNPSKSGERMARDEAREGLKGQMCNTVIYLRGVVEEAAKQGLTVIDYAPDSLSARQYERLAKEILP